MQVGSIADFIQKKFPDDHVPSPGAAKGKWTSGRAGTVGQIVEELDSLTIHHLSDVDRSRLGEIKYELKNLMSQWQQPGAETISSIRAESRSSTTCSEERKVAVIPRGSPSGSSLR